MVQESIKTALKNFGLTEKELEVYLLLARRGAQKTGQIAKQLKMNKGLSYRLLKNLQKKGVVETTLESPTRYIALSFEKVIDSYVKSKRKEVERIEEAKDSLLSDWNKISQEEVDSTLEKFGVIEGTKKVYKKISQLVEGTKDQISLVVSVYDLSKLDQFGVLEELSKTVCESKLKCQILTQISNSSRKAIKLLKARTSPAINLRGTNLSLGTPKFSRMIIRDDEELLLFISEKNEQSSKKAKDTCLITNSKTIIQSFSGVFEDLWSESVDIENLIVELETGKPASKTQIIKNPSSAREYYNEVLGSAESEIQIVTSSQGLMKLGKDKSTIEEWANEDISIRIMAPIVNENLVFAQELMKFAEVRHIPLGYFETTIVDRKHLFQFKQDSEKQGELIEPTFFENTFYTSDLDYIQRTINLLQDLWKKTRIPSTTPIQIISKSNYKQTHKVFRRIWNQNNLKLDYQSTEQVTEKDVLNKFKEVKRNFKANWSNSKSADTMYFLGARAFALVHPPKHFQLPEMIIGVLQDDEASTFGAVNMLKVFLRADKSKDSPFQLVAHVQNSPKSLSYRKSKLAGFPGVDNIILVNKEQLTVRVYGNTMFAGWTIPIQLYPSKYVLPPACILFEGYGEVHPVIFNLTLPSKRNQTIWSNNLDAFVSFFHPSSKYIGSGTEGTLDRESVQISYPNRKTM